MNQPIQLVDLQTQYQRLKPEIDAAMQHVVDHAQFIGGAAVSTFSKNLSKYLNVKHVIPCANGTDALQIALMALDLQPGDEVITTPFTFVATVEVVALLGLRPVFVDIHPDTFNIDETKLAAAITPRTRAIVPVHLFGQCANIEAIMQIAAQHDNITVIEDNAQAIGAHIITSDGNRVAAGTVGHIGTTSFFPSKNLGCYGDGGAIFTNDDTLAKKINLIANHGSSEKYYYQSIGVNSRLDGIQAAVLNVKLAHLDDFNRRRQAAAALYCQLLADVEGVTLPVVAPFSTHVWHQFTLRVSAARRGLIQQLLTAQGIPSAIYYPVSLHVQEAYRHYSYKLGDFPVSEKACREVLSLPMHSEMDTETLHFICEAISEAMIPTEMA